MVRHLLLLGACASAIALAAPAQAAVLVNGLPTGPLEQGYWTNDSSNQNFLVQFSLASAANVTGFEILSGEGIASLGNSLRVKLRNDVAGDPVATNAFSFVDQIDALSTYAPGVLKLTTNFAPIALAAGTYWFGVSGEGSSQVWASYNNGGPASPANQRQLSGDAVIFTPGIRNLAFNVLGDDAIAAVPEPATWLMMILGFGAIGYSLRRQRTSATVRFA